MTEKVLQHKKNGMAVMLLNLLGLVVMLAVMICGIVLAESGKFPVFGNVMAVAAIICLMVGWIPLLEIGRAHV